MDESLAKLNKDQLQAVTTKSQYVRIVAGAGSGKTRVLTTRIIFLINQWGIDPHKILAITFTNKATNEMRKRITAMVPDQAGRVVISTIHSLGVRILREDIGSLGMPRNFTIMDQEDQKAIIREAYKQLDLDSKQYTFGMLLDYIGNNKYAQFDGPRAMETAMSPFEKAKARVYQYYLDRQKELYALDFDDLLLLTVRLFKSRPEIRAKWQRRFQFIHVDEFQDIDDTQYEMIKLLTTPDTYLYVVGDPDQTIYTWRGANINIIINFEKDFTPCETVVLDRNYRSTQMILSAANSVIRYNRNRLKKDLYTANGEGTKVVHFAAPSEDSEAMFVAQRIGELRAKGASYNDMAVLYRSNYLSRPLEKIFIDMSIPYVIYGGIRFYERAEIKDALSYLRMLVTQDDLSYKRIINVPKRGVGTKSIDDLLDYARANGLSMYQAADKAPLTPKARKAITALNQQIEQWRLRSQDMDLETVLQTVLKESGYKAMLESSTDAFDQERLENLKELVDDIHGFGQANPEAGLTEYLQMVALYTDLQNEDDGQHVQLMTVHSAKGLEFDDVFVVGLSDGVFPSDKSMNDGLKGLEEERRLAYVAFTRAKQRLYLTESRGYSFATNSSKMPSRFLSEIDADFIDNIGVAVRPDHEGLADGTELMHTGFIPKAPNAKYKPGDQVTHDDFGDGVVISVNGNFGTIAFAYPVRTKTISLNFPKLHKKEAS